MANRSRINPPSSSVHETSSEVNRFKYSLNDWASLKTRLRIDSPRKVFSGGKYLLNETWSRLLRLIEYTPLFLNI